MTEKIAKREKALELQFAPDQIETLAKRYSYPGEERIVNEVGPAAHNRGFYTRREFL